MILVEWGPRGRHPGAACPFPGALPAAPQRRLLSCRFPRGEGTGAPLSRALAGGRVPACRPAEPPGGFAPLSWNQHVSRRAG